MGTDLVEVGRLRAAAMRRPGIKQRLFSPSEREYAERRADPWPALAVRFAAKEAGMKALGVGIGSVSFSDFEVRNRPGGEPVLHVSGRAARLAEKRGVVTWLCSLTHTSTLAHAVVLAIGASSEDVEGGRPG